MQAELCFSHIADAAKVLPHLRAIDLPEQRRSLLFITLNAGLAQVRISPDARQTVGSERDEVLGGEAARDVFDIRIESGSTAS